MYEPQRLHPAAILEFSIRNLYNLLQALFPLLLLAFGQPLFRRWILYILPVMLVLYVVYVVLYWLNYIYYIQENELRLEYGVLVKKKRYISFNRIQTVQVSAGIVQRLFGLVKLQVETAGGGNKAELILPAITQDKADALQRILQEGKGQNPERPNEETMPVHRLTTSALFMLASTSNSLGVVLAGLLAIVSQLDELVPGYNVWEILAESAVRFIPSTASALIAGALTLLLIAWLLSLIGNVIKFGGFELVRDGNNLTITRGLLEKKQLTLPLKRIQAIKLAEGIMRLPFGMVSIQAVSISNAGEKGEGNTLMPIIPRSQVELFMKEILPEFYIPIETEKLPLRARGHYLIINLIFAAAISIPVSILLPFGYFSLLTLPLAIWLGHLQYRDAGFKLEENIAIIRSRSLGRISTIVPRNKIQSLSVSNSYFQRIRSLTTLHLSIASGSIPARAKISGIDMEKSTVISCWYSEGMRYIKSRATIT